MIEQIKEHIKKCVLRIQESHARTQRIYKEGIDLINYETDFQSCIEEGVALMCANNNDQFEHALESLQWWVYNDVDKKIWDSATNEVLYDLNDIDNFIDYLTQHIKS